jgi:hypothetical protein
MKPKAVYLNKELKRGIISLLPLEIKHINKFIPKRDERKGDLRGEWKGERKDYKNENSHNLLLNRNVSGRNTSGGNVFNKNQTQRSYTDRNKSDKNQSERNQPERDRSDRKPQASWDNKNDPSKNLLKNRKK